ncbi:hypothetical protein RISK_002669 [Rhodopirellula islandica]|uniref:Uncharacterized protein n=1 Tax=Rhodopirellula islandica TaxID=595434 RepID=A0A0J1BFL9_RHOIS|nr:hypothetical protein RISK_002669 [Rhodopirellula islandica]
MHDGPIRGETQTPATIHFSNAPWAKPWNQIGIRNQSVKGDGLSTQSSTTFEPVGWALLPA